MISLERLREILNDNQTGHSNLQMDRFVTIQHGITPYGCYKQAVREVSNRFYSMLNLWMEMEILKIDERSMQKLCETHARRSMNKEWLELGKLRLKLMGLQQTYAETKREFVRYLAHADHFKKQIGELTEQKRDEFESEYWVEVLKRMGDGSQKLVACFDSEEIQSKLNLPACELPELPAQSATINIEQILEQTYKQKLLGCVNNAGRSLADCGPI